MSLLLSRRMEVAYRRNLGEIGGAYRDWIIHTEGGRGRLRGVEMKVDRSLRYRMAPRE